MIGDLSNILNAQNKYFMRFFSAPSQNDEWSGGKTSPLLQNKEIIELALNPLRQTFAGPNDMVANYAGWSADYKAKISRQFGTIPDVSSTRVLDQIKNMSNRNPAKISAFNDQERKLFLSFIGQITGNMYDKNQAMFSAKNKTFASMNGTVMQYMHELAYKGRSDIKIGVCRHIHAYLTHLAAQMGYRAYSVSVATTQPHHITFVRDAVGKITFFDYGNIYQTEVRDIVKGLGEYEKNNVPYTYGYPIFDDRERLLGLIQTPTNKRIYDVVGYQKPLESMNPSSTNGRSLNVGIGNYRESINYDTNTLNASMSYSDGRKDETYRYISGGYINWKKDIPLDLSSGGTIKSSMLTSLVGGFAGYRIMMTGDTAGSDSVMATGRAQHDLHMDHKKFNFVVGGVVQPSVSAMFTRINGQYGTWALPNLDYGGRAKFSFLIPEDRGHIYVSAGAQGIGYVGDAQYSSFDFVLTDIKFELGTNIKADKHTFSNAIYRVTNNFFLINGGQVGYRYDRMGLKGYYEYWMHKFPFVESRQAYSLSLERVFGDKKDLTVHISAGKSALEDGIEFKANCTYRFDTAAVPVDASTKERSKRNTAQ